MIQEKIKSGEEYFHTSNLKAAVALATMGFALKNPPVSRMTRNDGKESTVFWFESLNDKGQSASSVFRAVTTEADMVNEKDPEHPCNYIRAALMNRDVLVQLIRQTPRYVVVETNGKRIAIREDATEQDRINLSRKI